jgi:hypothetical protein
MPEEGYREQIQRRSGMPDPRRGRAMLEEGCKEQIRQKR